ncbi:unnamed protein product, partial [Mesorhabditis belari]|uniref:Uncharacterized protein n=1 Tax=Mesorhabditis belari TaxID=2138241 RepID=A0AAF3FHF5_9BILA
MSQVAEDVDSTTEEPEASDRRSRDWTATKEGMQWVVKCLQTPIPRTSCSTSTLRHKVQSNSLSTSTAPPTIGTALCHTSAHQAFIRITS